tara:strand:+ start:1244 stop:1927 length:684 start_codon:yes stop_codon:yes gene_type:complete
MFKRKSKTICFIPARKGSKRVKDKNLRKINNKTLIEITINQAKKTRLFSDILLSSDSSKILKIGKKLKITSIMRSKKNSRDNSTTDLALKETILKLNKNYDNIVVLQVTSPLRKVNTIKKFVKYCIKNKLNNCLTVSKQNDNISYYEKKYFSSLNKVRKLSQNRKPFLYENGLIYFISRKAFANNFRIYPKKNWNYYLTNKYESLDINDLEDLNICKILMKENVNKI